MEQIKAAVTGLSTAQKISIGVSAVSVLAGVLVFARWKHEQDFKPVYTGLAPEEAATVVQKVKESGSEYRLAENGATVLVPSAKLAELRLDIAASGLPKSGHLGFEIFD